MGISRKELISYLEELLKIDQFHDYGPNGLQVEGKNEIHNICFAVSATKDSISQAIKLRADALIVHHGLFWNFHGARPIIGPFAQRIKPLIQNDINLLGFHLPLDAHDKVGNAAAIAEKIDLKDLGPFGDYKGSPTGVHGRFSKAISPSDLQEKLKKLLDHEIILSCPEDLKQIETMGIITGGANSDWKIASEMNIDSYLTGEISEHDWHDAKEHGVAMFAGGHNATESLGIQRLMDAVEKQFNENITVNYIPSPNPA